jgi:hypothetical protein
MLPEEAAQVTDFDEVVPCTVAENCILPFGGKDAETGEIVTDVTGAGLCGAGTGPAVTVTIAEADFVESALLVAVTVALSGDAGAE